MDSEETIFDLPRERLDLIDHDVCKWVCCAEGCDRSTTVRDYGEDPLYFHPSKNSAKRNWMHKDRYSWYCGKHWPMFKKSIPFKFKEKTSMGANLVFVKSVTVANLKLHE